RDVIAVQPLGLALAGHHADPVERAVGASRVVAAVLHVIPDAGDDRQQLEADPLVVADRVPLPAPLDPPVAVLPRGDAAELELLLGHLASPARRRVGHRPAVIAGGEQDAAAERLAVRVLDRERLAGLGAALASEAHLGAGLE